MNAGSQKIIADLLSARTGQQLTEDRSWRIGTALSGIFRQIGISNVDQLVCLLDQPAHSTLAQQVVELLRQKWVEPAKVTGTQWFAPHMAHENARDMQTPALVMAQ